MTRRGWGAWSIGVAGVIFVAVVAGGCRKRGPQPGGAGVVGGGGGAGAGGGPAVEALGQSSLERAKRGLPPQEGGVLGDVHFDFDSYRLDAEAQRVLEANAEWLRANPRSKVEIEGHCDERGTIEYNLALGARRARAVRDQLVALGIDPDRLSTISYGEELPLCYEHTEKCWARNRRAHFVILTR